MTDYIKVKAVAGSVNYIRIDLDYSKGGYNYFTYKQEARGYYIHVSPVEKNGYMETYVGFSGVKACLLEVTRKSNKAEAEAMEIFQEVKDKYIDFILEKNNLTLEV